MSSFSSPVGSHGFQHLVKMGPGEYPPGGNCVKRLTEEHLTDVVEAPLCLCLIIHYYLLNFAPGETAELHQGLVHL